MYVKDRCLDQRHEKFMLLMLQIVNGCITDDGDCFLYGAHVVYRNFTIDPKVWYSVFIELED